jgi:hypothetical protein
MFYSLRDLLAYFEIPPNWLKLRLLELRYCTFQVTPYNREHTEWQRPLSGVLCAPYTQSHLLLKANGKKIAGWHMALAFTVFRQKQP